MPRITKQSTVSPDDPDLRIDLDEITVKGAPSTWAVTIRRGGVVEAETKYGSRQEAVTLYVSMARESRLDHDQRELARQFAESLGDPGVAAHKFAEAQAVAESKPLPGCFICNGDHATDECPKMIQ